LDQFRGYTVLGMMLVNYFGGYAACPQILKHTHDYCSYADTIMPHFLFAVGFALRLTLGRRAEEQGMGAAYWRMTRRFLGLALVSLVIYNVGPRAPHWQQLTELGFWGAIKEPLKRSWFQTLMHIAVTSLWLLPVLRASPRVRVGWMLLSAVAHIVLSYWFNFVWTNTPPNAIDGGPLGFLTWCIPATLGTLACDLFVPAREALVLGAKQASDGVPDASMVPSASRVLTKAIGWALVVMAIGYVFSCGTRFYDVPESLQESLRDKKLAEHPVWPARQPIGNGAEVKDVASWFAEPPFVKPPDAVQRKWNYWMMSQRAGTLSYLTFSGGFSLLVFGLFYWVCDRWGLQLPLFKTFGTNALVAYVLHSMVSSAVQPFFPKDSPAWYALLGLGLFFWITWLFVRQLEKQGAYLRV
jgi:hypothetical protein